MQKNVQNISMRIEEDLKALKQIGYVLYDIEKNDIYPKIISIYKDGYNGIYEDILIVDENGYGESILSNEKYDLEGATYIEETFEKKEALVSSSYLEIYSTEEHIVYTAPIYMDDGDVENILVVRIDLAKMLQALDVDLVDDKTSTYVVNRYGKIVSKYSYYEKENYSGSIYTEYDLKNVDMFDKDERVEVLESEDGGLFLSYKKIPSIDDYYVVTAVSYTDIFEGVKGLIYIYFGIVLAQVILFLWYFKYNIKRHEKNVEDLENLAYNDELCDIYNLKKFKIVSNKFMEVNDFNYYIIRMNVNNFKYINGQFGHKVGDEVLKYISFVLMKSINDEEVCARIDNEKFILLLKFTSQDDIINRLKYIEDEINKYTINSNTSKSVKCDYYIYNMKKRTSNTTLDDVIDRLGIFEMVYNKSDDDNDDYTMMFYDDKIKNTILYNKKLQDDLLNGINNDEFKLYVQPKHEINSGKMYGGEVLIRWQRDEEFIYPNNFIELFEENRSIIRLDMYVISQVCKTIRIWLDKGYDVCPLAINVSKVTLYSYEFAARVNNIIKANDIDPSLIEIEITESMDFENAKLLTEKVNRLKDIGVKVSIDDFGSGYSSFNILTDLPIDILKIDKSFLLKSDLGKNNEMIIKSIVDMAKNLDLKVVVEGVETNEHLDFLKGINCDLGQGYLFSRPLPIKEFENRLRSKI